MFPRRYPAAPPVRSHAHLCTPRRLCPCLPCPSTRAPVHAWTTGCASPPPRSSASTPRRPCATASRPHAAASPPRQRPPRPSRPGPGGRRHPLTVPARACRPGSSTTPPQPVRPIRPYRGSFLERVTRRMPSSPAARRRLSLRASASTMRAAWTTSASVLAPEAHLLDEATVKNRHGNILEEDSPQRSGPAPLVFGEQFILATFQFLPTRITLRQTRQLDLNPDERGPVGVFVFLQPIGVDQARRII